MRHRLNLGYVSGMPLTVGMLACSLVSACGIQTAPSSLPIESSSPISAVSLSANSCHSVGQLPDLHCTPGDVDHAVTQANIQQTICRAGWSTAARPPESVTEPMKRQLMAAYGMGGALSTTILDHLAPVELGGATDQANLWPQPPDQARKKDVLENRLHQLVCDGQVQLGLAQRAITSDWVAAYDRYAD